MGDVIRHAKTVLMIRQDGFHVECDDKKAFMLNVHIFSCFSK